MTEPVRKVNEWQSTIVWGIVLIFFGGMAYKTLQIVDAKTVANAAGIVKVSEKVDENRERIHKNELVQTEINTKLNSIPKIEREIEKLTDYLMDYDYNQKKDK